MAGNFTYLGQADLTGNLDTLFRTEWMPEILAAYARLAIVSKYVRKKTITSGKSASFTVMGTSGAKYISIGDKVLGNQQVAKNSVEIFVDPILVSDIKLAEIDEAMSAIDDRAQMVNECVTSLVTTEDEQLLQCMVLAARAAGIVTGRDGGSQVFASTLGTDGEDLAQAIGFAGVLLDGKNVRDNNDRTCFLRPLQYHLLVTTDKTTDKNLGGDGNYAQGIIHKIENINLVKTNSLPITNIAAPTSSETSPNNIYYGDFSDTVGVISTPMAVGQVKLRGLKTKVAEQPDEFSTVIAVYNMQGQGILRSDCAVELSTYNAGTSYTTYTT